MAIWPQKKLIDLLRVQNGFAFDSKRFSDEKGMPLIRIRDIKNGIGTETKYTGPYDKGYIVNAGDFLIGMDGEFNCYEWLGEPALLNQRVCRLQNFSNTVSPRFLLHGINTFLKQIEDRTGYTTVKHLSSKAILDIDFPLPPLPEQKRIVAILDEAFSGIARAKEIAEKNLANAKEIFESYLQGVFANPGEDWKKKTLGDVCSLITDGKHGDCENEANSGYYFLSAKDVKYDILNYENARQITKDGFEETHRRTNLKPGDICMVNTGATIGRISIAPDNPKTYKTTFQKSVAVIKTIPSLITSSYCCYLLKSDLNKLVKVSSGTAVHNLLLGDLKKHVITIPSLQEQKRIVAYFDSLLAETKKLEYIYRQKLSSLEALKKSLLHQAFSGALTGGAAS
jgi:type I restriction enzyme S subunit